MRTREEILKEQEREFGSNERYKYVVEALLDIRDLLANQPKVVSGGPDVNQARPMNNGTNTPITLNQ